jgi:hypothetical protein
VSAALRRLPVARKRQTGLFRGKRRAPAFAHRPNHGGA